MTSIAGHVFYYVVVSLRGASVNILEIEPSLLYINKEKER